MEQLKELFLEFKTLTENLHDLLSRDNTLLTENLDEILNMRQDIIDKIDTIPHLVNDDIKAILADITQIDQKSSQLLLQQMANLKSDIAQINHNKLAMGAYKEKGFQIWGVFIDNKK